MGRTRKHTSKWSKKVFGISIVSGPITLDEEKQVGPIPLFNETSYEFWKGRMEAYLGAHGYDVWCSIIYWNIYTNESRRYNTKEMNVILSALPHSMRSNVGQYTSTK